MLNENKERELAYIVVVDNVEPIDGYDKIAYATVGGWHCVVGADMQAGDKAIYFEIDSLLPSTDQRFAFCEKYHYKVKTQKYCKGSRISQGLLLPITEFPEFVDAEVGTFVTKQLGVTYYDPMDRARKSNGESTPQYKNWFKRWSKRFPFKQLLSTRIGRKVLLPIFTVKKKKRVWPDFIPKTDEERCLVANTFIDTNKGKIRIADIVMKDLDILVKSVSSEGEIEYKPVIGKQILDNNDDFIEFTYAMRPYGNRTVKTKCSPDHKFFNGTEYVEARKLNIGDTISSCVIAYRDEVIPYVYGCLLGDGHLSIESKKSLNGYQTNSVSVELTQGIDQIDYLKWKQNLLDIEKLYTIKSGYTGKTNVYRAVTPVDYTITHSLYDDDAIVDRKLYISEKFCKKLTKESIAILYQDDGSLTHCNCKSDTYWIRIATNRYSYDEVERLRKKIEQLFDIEVYHTKDKQQYESLEIRTPYVDKFLSEIQNYIHPQMKYKLTEKYRFANFELLDLHFERQERLTKNWIIDKKVIPYNKTKKPKKKIYDITVADNHNFFANGALTHNCQNMIWIFEDKTPYEVTEKVDGASTSFGIRRGKHGKYEYYVCSRNVVFPSADQTSYYAKNIWWEMYEKYNIKDFLTDFLEKTGAEWVYLQGETFGDGVQKRDYSIKCRDFRAFVLCTSQRVRYSYVETKEILDQYNIPTVPIIDTNFILPDTADELITYAAGPSVIDGLPREGVVLRSVNDPTKSFKAVDPAYLLRFHG